MACYQGFDSRLSINGQQMQFLRARDLSYRELVNNSKQAITGSLNPKKERQTLGRLIVGLEITMNPSPAELDVILPLCGYAESPTDTFTLGDSLSTFTTVLDKVSKVHTYGTCMMGRHVLSGQRGGAPIMLTLQILGLTLTEGTDFGSPTALDTDINYAFHEGTLTLGGNAINFDRFAYLCDPHLEVAWNNSATATQICPTYRDLVLSASTPYGTANELGLFTTPLASAAGIAGTLAFTRGNQSTSMAFANMKNIARPPSVMGKGQIRLPVHYELNDSGATSAVIITHDASA